MAKAFKCGLGPDGKERVCSEEEIQTILKVRGGELKAVDPNVDLAGQLAAMRESLDPEKIAAKVGEVVNAQNSGAGFLSYLKHEADCPNCRELHRKYVAEHSSDYGMKEFMAGADAGAGLAETVAAAAAEAATASAEASAEEAAKSAAKPAAEKPAADEEEPSAFRRALDAIIPVGK